VEIPARGSRARRRGDLRSAQVWKSSGLTFNAKVRYLYLGVRRETEAVTRCCLFPLLHSLAPSGSRSVETGFHSASSPAPRPRLPAACFRAGDPLVPWHPPSKPSMSTSA